jgi:hypothetical protein
MISSSSILKQNADMKGDPPMIATAMAHTVILDERQGVSVIVSVHGQENPSDAAWNAYLKSIDDALRYHGGDAGRVRGLSISAGGGPSGLQRARLEDVQAGRVIKVSIITHSTLVRGMVTVLRWLNPAIRAFAPLKFADAIRYLELPTSTQILLRTRLKIVSADVPEATLLLSSLDSGFDPTLERNKSKSGTWSQIR